MTLLLSISIATVMGFSFPASVHSHKNGAPVKACGFMNPGHGVAGQHSASPFVVTPSQTTYQCRETIKVNVTSTDDSKIRGFLCQARTDAFSYSTVVGFLNEDATDGMKMNHICGMGRGLTHTNNTDKEAIKLTWFAEEPYGPVTFICTVVKERTKFWTRQVSVPIRYQEGGDCNSSGHVTLSVGTMTILIGVALLN